MNQRRDALKKNNRAISRNIGDELILVPIKGEVGDLSSIFTFNAVGRFIWEQIDGERSAQEIAGMVADSFDVDIETASRDVAEFMRELESYEIASKACEQ